MDIKYKIQFHSNWHCGSGLAAGADVDALVIKDRENMPFIPGKTIKGLVREAVNDLFAYGNLENKTDLFIETFGVEASKQGHAYFTNAVILDKEHEYIVANSLDKYMYQSVSNTAIDEDGIATEHSLRKTQVVVPCVLYGEIKDVSEKIAKDIVKSFGLIKSLGQGRNRGLGRCTISEI